MSRVTAIEILRPGPPGEGMDPGQVAELEAFKERTDPGAAGAFRQLIKIIDGNPRWQDDIVVNVKDFGAIGDGTTDDTAAIQAADDYAQTLAGGTDTWRANIPELYFPAGRYLITDTIGKQSAPWRGAGVRQGTRILWGGGNGGTMIEQTETYPGAASFGGISQMSLSASDNTNHRPDYHIDISSAGIDVLYQLQYLHLSACGVASIKTRGWFNVHWSHIRWDSIFGYALHLIPGATQFASSFVLDQFTYDHNTSGGEGEGFLLVDNQNGAPNTGPITLSNARIEVNQPWIGTKAIVHIKHDDTVIGPGIVPLRFSNISYQDSASMADDVAVYRDTDNTTQAENIIFDNCVFSGMSALGGGTWPTGFSALPPIPSGGRIRQFIIGEGSGIDYAAQLNIRRGASSGAAIEVSRHGDSVARLRVTPDGAIEAGTGSATRDAVFSRQSAKTWGVAADNALRTGRGATGDRLSAAGVGQGALWYDTTLGRHISSNGSAWGVNAQVITNTATLNFGEIAAGATAELTITVTGAAVNDPVSLGPPATLEAGLVATGYVSATNTVTVRLANVTASPIDPASATWRATIAK